MKINVSVCRKVATQDDRGKADYGSIGASASAEFEVPDELRFDPEGFHAEEERAYGLLERAVLDELGRLRGTDPGQPARRPAGDRPGPQQPSRPRRDPGDDDDRGHDRPRSHRNGYHQDGGRNGFSRNGNGNGTVAGVFDPGRANPGRPQRGQPQYTEPAGLVIDDGPAPRSGRSLYAWLRKQDRRVMRRAGELGNKLGYPEAIVQWEEDEVAEVYSRLLGEMG